VNRFQKTLLAIGTLLFFATSSFVCQRVADRGRFTGSYSSYGSGPLGTRALYLLAQRLGAHPARWAEDLAALPRGTGMLVALGDCESGMARPLSRYEEEELTHWVADGGTLLVVGARHYVPKTLGVRFEPEPHCTAGWRLSAAKEEDEEKHEAVPPSAVGPKANPIRDADPSDAGPGVVLDPDEIEPSDGARLALEDGVLWTSPVAEPLIGLQPLPMRHPGRLALATDASSTQILSRATMDNAPASDAAAGVVVRHGKGRVIVLASGSMLQNRALGLSDGGVMFARLLHAYAAGGPVLFDEYHLGVGEKRSLVRYLREAGATPFLAQLLLAVFLLLWRSGARFGGVRELARKAPAGTASFVGAIGSVFVRTADDSGALRILAKQALARVASYHHLALSSAHNLARTLADRGLPEAAEAVRDIGQAERLLASEGGLARASQKLDDAVARACR
jgi:hypothetical protein